jgi:phosphate transport system permease protein
VADDLERGAADGPFRPRHRRAAGCRARGRRHRRLIATAAGFDALNANPFHGQQDSLPLFIYKQVRIGLLDAQTQRAWTGALVLLLIVLFLFTAARLLSRPKSGSRLRRQTS